MSSKPERVFPAFGGPPERQKAAEFQRLPPIPGKPPGSAAGSEPFGPATVRAAVAIIAIPVEIAAAGAVVAVATPVHAAHPHPVVAPALFPAAEPAHMGQDGKPA